jgi:hypothetical protein
MSDNFLTHWFHGLDQALGELDDRSLGALMTRCGRACSESFSKQVYLEQYREAADLDDFLARLNRAFGDLSARRLGPDEIEIRYSACGCDLVRDGYIRSPKLCLCSLESLRYNWEAVLGKGRVDCRMETSILRGGDCCRFIVKIVRGDGV